MVNAASTAAKSWKSILFGFRTYADSIFTFVDYTMFKLLILVLALISSSSAFRITNNARRSVSSMSMKVNMDFKKMVSSLLVGAYFLGGNAAAVLADAVPTVNSPAPAFSLPSNLGKDLGTADLKGSWSVVYFYPGDFTQGCTIEAQGFERDFSQYEKMGVKILGVSVDSVDKHLDFQKKYGLEFPLVSDKGGAVSGKYGSLIDLGFVGKFSNRQTYIIDPQGDVKFVFTDVESSVAQHSENVLKKLKEIKV